MIEQLHEGVQCHTCGARFTMDDHEKYRAHLDWHFRQNKLEQEMVKVAKNRKWFYSITVGGLEVVSFCYNMLCYW